MAQASGKVNNQLFHLHTNLGTEVLQEANTSEWENTFIFL